VKGPIALLLLLAAPVVARSARPDVFVFVLDDVADADIDTIRTPNIDALAARGVRYRRAYAMPQCMPSRHAILFGAFVDEGHGLACAEAGPETLDHAVPSLPKAMAGAGYRTALFGKWHLGSNRLGPWELTPHFHGFETWRAGLPVGAVECGGTGYTDWVRVDDGVVRRETTYVLEAIRDSFLAWLDEDHGDEPSFAVVAFQTAHLPWQVPPAHLLPPRYRVGDKLRGQYEAMVVALDRVLGEMLARVDPDAWIVLVGDNGTPFRVSDDKGLAKFTVFERGIRVPFLLAGPGLEPGESQRLVHLVDVWPSLAGALGLPCQAPDGVSVLGEPRQWIYCVQRENKWAPRSEEAIVEERWKLRVVGEAREEYYDLTRDPDEKKPMRAGRIRPNIVERLHDALEEARGSL